MSITSLKKQLAKYAKEFQPLSKRMKKLLVYRCSVGKKITKPLRFER